ERIPTKADAHRVTAVPAATTTSIRSTDPKAMRALAVAVAIISEKNERQRVSVRSQFVIERKEDGPLRLGSPVCRERPPLVRRAEPLPRGRDRRPDSFDSWKGARPCLRRGPERDVARAAWLDRDRRRLLRSRDPQ